MKKVYERPLMSVERFVPNEYVAACGDTEFGAYLFECNAGIADGHYAVINRATGKYFTGTDPFGNKYLITGTLGGTATQDGITYTQSYFYPCGITHEADKDSDFIEGYYIDNVLTSENENISVVIWTGDGTEGIETHCTTVLNRESWETTKS